MSSERSRHLIWWTELLGIDVVHLDAALMTADSVDELHRSGFLVHGANLDPREQIQRGMGLGIDQLSTGHLGMALNLRNAFFESSSEQEER